MSRRRLRLFLTPLAAGLALAAASPAAAARPDSTWLPLAVPLDATGSPVFAVAVSPTDAAALLVGTGGGAILRSSDAGATWKPVRAADGHGVMTIAFNPYRPGVVLAGLQGGGIARSTDAGATWTAAGADRATVRAFGFARNLTVAGGDQGVLVSPDAASWSAAGLATVDVSGLAVVGAADPPKIVAGGDATRGAEAVPLYQTADGGATWRPLNLPPSASTMVATLAAAPVGKDPRPVALGTNAGLFTSGDGNAFNAIRAGTLPAGDFTAAGFVRDHPERIYVASDGGASSSAGLWSTIDGGATFRNLSVPVPVVTALSVSTEDVPTLYVATFRPIDHLATIWAYRDTGAAPQGQAPPPPASGQAAAPASSPAAPSGSWWRPLLRGPELPYLALAGSALVVLLVAMVAHVARGRER